MCRRWSQSDRSHPILRKRKAVFGLCVEELLDAVRFEACTECFQIPFAVQEFRKADLPHLWTRLASKFPNKNFSSNLSIFPDTCFAGE